MIISPLTPLLCSMYTSQYSSDTSHVTQSWLSYSYWLLRQRPPLLIQFESSCLNLQDVFGRHLDCSCCPCCWIFNWREGHLWVWNYCKVTYGNISSTCKFGIIDTTLGKNWFLIGSQVIHAQQVGVYYTWWLFIIMWLWNINNKLWLLFWHLIFSKM